MITVVMIIRTMITIRLIQTIRTITIRLITIQTMIGIIMLNDFLLPRGRLALSFTPAKLKIIRPQTYQKEKIILDLDQAFFFQIASPVVKLWVSVGKSPHFFERLVKDSLGRPTWGFFQKLPTPILEENVSGLGG